MPRESTNEPNVRASQSVFPAKTHQLTEGIRNVDSVFIVETDVQEFRAPGGGGWIALRDARAIGHEQSDLEVNSRILCPRRQRTLVVRATRPKSRLRSPSVVDFRFDVVNTGSARSSRTYSHVGVTTRTLSLALHD